MNFYSFLCRNPRHNSWNTVLSSPVPPPHLSMLIASKLCHSGSCQHWTASGVFQQIITGVASLSQILKHCTIIPVPTSQCWWRVNYATPVFVNIGKRPGCFGILWRGLQPSSQLLKHCTIIPRSPSSQCWLRVNYATQVLVNIGRRPGCFNMYYDGGCIPHHNCWNTVLSSPRSLFSMLIASKLCHSGSC